jgi:hypothetical protein
MAPTYRWDKINSESRLELENYDKEVNLEEMQVALMALPTS